MKVRLRDDLAQQDFSIPSYELPDKDAKVTWLDALQLDGAESAPSDSDYAYLKLASGKYVFVNSIDLDWGE